LCTIARATIGFIMFKPPAMMLQGLFHLLQKGGKNASLVMTKPSWNLNNTKHLEDKFVMNPIYTLWRIKVLNQMTGAQQIIGIL